MGPAPKIGWKTARLAAAEASLKSAKKRLAEIEGNGEVGNAEGGEVSSTQLWSNFTYTTAFHIFLMTYGHIYNMFLFVFDIIFHELSFS